MKLYPSVRPYWHVDAKWICGLLFVFCLFVTLLLATAVKLTDENRGPKIAALAIGSMFIRDDSLTDIDEMKRTLKKQGGVIRPLPTMPEVTITKQDLSLSATEIKLKVFTPLTTILYNDGIEATAKRFATSPKEEQKFINDASALRLFTKQTHNSLNGLLGIFSTLSALLLIGVIYFSARWGRLANFGLQLFIVGVPGSLLGLLLTNPPKNGDSALGFLPVDIATELGVVIGEVYYWIAISGLLILLLALIGRVISFVTKKTTRKPPTTNDAKPQTTTTT